MEYFENLLITLPSAGVVGAVIFWLLKNFIQERIKQAIHNEYQENMEKLKSDLKIKSDYESEILNTHIHVYWKLGKQITTITHNLLQLLSRCATVMHEGQVKGKTEKEILNSINMFFSKESLPIIESSMLLKKYYILLPVCVIENLQEFEAVVWRILKEHDFGISSLLIEAQENLLKSIREVNAKLLSGEVMLSSILADIPIDGFTPKYIKTALDSNEKNNLTKGST